MSNHRPNATPDPVGPVHVETGRFTVTIDLSASFDADYEGDDDGNAWLERWRATVRPRLARAVFDALREGGEFDVIPTSRGANPDDNLAIDARLRVRR